MALRSLATNKHFHYTLHLITHKVARQVTKMLLIGCKILLVNMQVRICSLHGTTHWLEYIIRFGFNHSSYPLKWTPTELVFNIHCIIGRAKRALHTSESQLRSDTYTYMFISSKV